MGHIWAPCKLVAGMMHCNLQGNTHTKYNENPSNCLKVIAKTKRYERTNNVMQLRTYMYVYRDNRYITFCPLALQDNNSGHTLHQV